MHLNRDFLFVSFLDKICFTASLFGAGAHNLNNFLKQNERDIKDLLQRYNGIGDELSA